LLRSQIDEIVIVTRSMQTIIKFLSDEYHDYIDTIKKSNEPEEVYKDIYDSCANELNRISQKRNDEILNMKKIIEDYDKCKDILLVNPTYDSALTKLLIKVDCKSFDDALELYTSQLMNVTNYLSNVIKISQTETLRKQMVIKGVDITRQLHNTKISFNSVTIKDEMSTYDQQALILNPFLYESSSKLTKLDLSLRNPSDIHNTDQINIHYQRIMKSLKCDVCKQFGHNKFYCFRSHCKILCKKDHHTCTKCILQNEITPNHICTLNHCTKCNRHVPKSHQCYAKNKNEKSSIRRNNNNHSSSSSNKWRNTENLMKL
jgi:hypothetical protein